MKNYPNNNVEDSTIYNYTNANFIADTRIAEITSEQEIKEVEAAISLSIDPVKIHIVKALELMSDRENPDYRNSIKESISAVESLVNNISGKKNATLTDALNEIIKQKKIILAPSLKLGLEKIYGYTSASDGIRHSLAEEIHNLTQDDARFMLIVCSAFVNYLKSKTSATE